MPELSHIIKEEIPLGLRLDRYVSEYLRLFSRSQIKARAFQGKINGKNVKVSRIVKQNDTLWLSWNELPPPDIIPQDIPLEIIYEDKNCIVINNQQGLVVHPGAGNRDGTFANAICFRKLKQEGNSFPAGFRPGIVHRLDKETSGIIIAAYDEEALVFLSDQFKARKVKKTYIAVIAGVPKKKKGCIETCIIRDGGDRKRFTVSSHGKKAVTFYKVIKTWRNYSLVLLRPKTGRTHQLRVHMKYLGHPILGDTVYSPRRHPEHNPERFFPGITLMLHSKSLKIILPDESEKRVFSSQLPQRFNLVIEQLNGGNSTALF
jgi:23S rRNA pseudouridine1911/1915/1917 synthase